MLSEGRSRRSDFGCVIVGTVIVGLLFGLWVLFAGVAIVLWRLLA